MPLRVNNVKQATPEIQPWELPVLILHLLQEPPMIE